jgi:hypothetical protein
MSSLAISVLILAVSAIIAVVVVNVGQALGRRRRLAAARAALEGDQAKEPGILQAGTSKVAAPAELPLPAGAPRAPAASRSPRREPRLGEFSEPEGSEEPSFSGSGEVRSETRVPAPAAGAAVSGPPDGTKADYDHGGHPASAPGLQANPGASAGSPQGPAVAPWQAGREEVSAPVAVPVPVPVLSPVCDCIVTLPLDNPVRGERLIALTQGIRRAGGKPILVDAVPVGASEEDAVPLAPGASYWALRIGVLLANRSGPLNAMEYSDFVSSVQSVADQLSALADTPDMADAIALARDLDATCAQLDAQIGLNVDVPEPLGPAQVAQLAAALRLAERGGHRYAWLGPNGEVIFTMSLTDSPQRLGFLLDVPRTPESLDGWSLMLDCAQKVAGHLSGRLVDDSGRPIQLESLGTIGRQLAQRYQSLEALGLAAGSPLALRVFN